MRKIEILGKNRFATWTARRVACRDLVFDGENVLLNYETVTDQYGIPGGGVEGRESLEACCSREIAEETGILVATAEKYLVIHEFYEEFLYETHYFVCNKIGEVRRNLTSGEQKVGMISKWVDIEDAMAIFSKHQEYAETDEEKRGIYLREYMALQEWFNKNKIS